MTAPIDLATDAEIAEALRLDSEATPGPWDDVGVLTGGGIATVAVKRTERWIDAKPVDQRLMGVARALLPKMATHLAALKVAILAAGPGRKKSMDFLRSLCGDGTTRLVLVPAAELARLKAIEAQSKAPIHYAAVGHLCGAWERGARATSDHAFVTCADCREHFIPDDPEQGFRQTRFGEECPKCWEKLPPCDDGDTVKCSECKTEFLRADGLPALFPMEPEESTGGACDACDGSGKIEVYDPVTETGPKPATCERCAGAGTLPVEATS